MDHRTDHEGRLLRHAHTSTDSAARRRPRLRARGHRRGLAEHGAYDRRDWDSFEDTAAVNGVTIIPEIDAPAHSLAFTRFRPSLGLDNGDSDHLDLSKPETTVFMKSVFDQFVPWFRSPDVHFGADEYTVDKPRYKIYFNEMAAHVRALGKHPRAWGSLSVMAADADGYDRDVTLNWETASAADYDIQVSDDVENWKTVAAARSKPTGARVDELTLAPVTGRYVRMQGIKRTSSFGYSLRRFEVRATSPEADVIHEGRQH
ncbi:family 20 glycosylhydrolase [Streptomyces sp. NPDC020125]|uniref:family 20 glycosylhydrolase n=1 Tax=Streptomyces sp. NPDC020125 TaxID=3154593 RepID=UPI0033FA8A22